MSAIGIVAVKSKRYQMLLYLLSSATELPVLSLYGIMKRIQGRLLHAKGYSDCRRTFATYCQCIRSYAIV